MWWHLVGSAIEHAAELHAKETAERVAAMVDDADRGRAGFDAAVIAFDDRLGRSGLAGGVAEIANDIIMQRALVALERQH